MINFSFYVTWLYANMFGESINKIENWIIPCHMYLYKQYIFVIVHVSLFQYPRGLFSPDELKKIKGVLEDTDLVPKHGYGVST